MCELATVYTTRHALSRGIQKVAGTISSDYFRPLGRVVFNSYAGEGREWHRTMEGALNRAEQMRAQKLKSLLAQMGKLKKINFTKHMAKAEPMFEAFRRGQKPNAIQRVSRNHTRRFDDGV
ncbi:hypothetical protein [Kaistia terrae]|uniref:Uncharacterized protein n=1 Tax=Kaistia terrae TaxID=537017 RepID=A0ABW0Q1C3_9HYPH|nr:hypothetical protein [Kaistia terrae]MCX5581754.1 hypothetical protein [Kaistia terrae]